MPDWFLFKFGPGNKLRVVKIVVVIVVVVVGIMN